MKTYQIIVLDQSGQRTLRFTGLSMQDAIQQMFQTQLPANTIFSITATTL